MAPTIPLFPLRTVLFPGMPLPLRIFEERYKVMTSELLASGGEFGVLLIKEGQELGGGAVPFDVGTTAVIEEHEEVDGGRFVLSCRGRKRFRLLRMLPPRPYPFGEVELMDDSSFTQTAALDAAMSRVRREFPEYFRLALALTDQWARPFELPTNPHKLVNQLGPWLKADESAKQRLLELESGEDRVNYLSGLLERLRRETADDVARRQRQRFSGLGAGN